MPYPKYSASSAAFVIKSSSKCAGGGSRGAIYRRRMLRCALSVVGYVYNRRSVGLMLIQHGGSPTPSVSARNRHVARERKTRSS
jgi:hypothetical protein